MTALARLLEQATPGPWSVSYGRHPEQVVPTSDREFAFVSADPRDDMPMVRRPLAMREKRQGGPFAEDARLIALAPDMARLLIDMAAEVDRVQRGWGETINGHFRRKKLLARFAELEQRAAP